MLRHRSLPLTIPAARFSLGLIRVEFDISWLLILPLLIVGAVYFVLPVAAPMLAPLESWGIAIVLVLLYLASLLWHVCGHALATRVLQGTQPEYVPVGLLGDPAQVWPLGNTAWREVAAILAGPCASLLLAGLCYLLWEAQLHPYVTTCAILLGMLNAGLTAINMAPCFPFDGGRFTRVQLATMLDQPFQSVRWSFIAGQLFGMLLLIWSGILLAQSARFSLETGAGTLAVAALMLASLRYPGATFPKVAEEEQQTRLYRVTSWLAFLVVFCTQLGSVLCLLPTVDGLYAPGPAVVVQPMIRLAEERRTEPAGSFLLTTVIAQTPIVLGQRIYAGFSPAFALVPPERIVPRNTTPQEVMRRNVNMLEESEATAIVVAMQLAGYDQAVLTSSALEIMNIVPESPLAGQAQMGDLLVSINGTPVATVAALRAEIAKHQAGDTVEVLVERTGVQRSFTTTLIGPAEAGGPPRLGVALQPIGLEVDLPFDVAIVPQKIAGGPSAGLMFTLTIYDLLVQEDLTHGWRIAGTGTIAPDGTVGPIGGIAQKVAGAEWAGAEYFIVPQVHYDEALLAAKQIKLIPVSTAQEAIDALKALPDK